ncbi:HAD domain-containing protein [Paraburkholderia adhaesiva]|uniref:HAD domain-containing protein n=1 Tax=Paraburkholderia adhaesiva TaxID=2883244 RepID=UPI001EE9E2EF|nr:HAD domain-containing protein [Paraburkholderia adhaesiva]
MDTHLDPGARTAIEEPAMRPRRPGGLVLYLDFDGVLHPEDVWRRPRTGPYVASPSGHALFEHAALLARCLEPYPELRIVLSTSWVRVFRSVSKVARRLPPELRRRVVGATFHGRMDPAWFQSVPRGVQVWGDVCRRQPTAWLALDDDDAGWPAACRDHLLHTDPVLGISDPAVLAQLQARLAVMHRPEVGWP